MKEVNEMLAFSTPIWSTQYPEHVEVLNKACDPYIKNKREKNLTANKKNKSIHKKFRTDFGLSHHSANLMSDNQFKFFMDIVTDISSRFMTNSGFDLTGHKGLLTELWVQEFSKLGGGHHMSHAHWNTHVSGFYFLKGSHQTSYPLFQDPRPGALVTKIMEKDFSIITPASSEVHFKIEPGKMIIFPGYLAHGFPWIMGYNLFDSYIGIYNMLKAFNKKKYKIIKKAIPASMASFLTDYFFLKHQVVAKLFLDGFITRDRVEWGSWVDTQNQSTYSCYADMTSETLLLRLHPLIEKHSGRKLIPTYSYMRLYKKGDVLETHIDRPECEISATLNLGGAKWPLFFKDGNKKAFSISFTPGDLALYRGCELQHWREPLEGEYCVQVFLHYTNEDNKHLKFDTRAMPGLPNAYKESTGWFKHSQLNMDILKNEVAKLKKDK